MTKYVICSVCGIQLDPEFDHIYPISFSNDEQTWTENGCKRCAEKVKYDMDDHYYSSVVADAPSVNEEEDDTDI
jgi:5-methylcytosine-specific restriction endonuclease McrA